MAPPDAPPPPPPPQALAKRGINRKNNVLKNLILHLENIFSKFLFEDKKCSYYYLF